MYQLKGEKKRRIVARMISIRYDDDEFFKEDQPAAEKDRDNREGEITQFVTDFL